MTRCQLRERRLADMLRFLVIGQLRARGLTGPPVNTQPEMTLHPNHADNDLAELKGIGPKHAEMLRSIGVHSVKELSHRNAGHLKVMIETRHGRVVALSEQECQTWIDEAQAHVRA